MEKYSDLGYLLSKMDYEQYWRVRISRPLPPRVFAIEPLIEPDSSVLDVGCGDGELFNHVNSRKRLNNWHGIDISSCALEKSRSIGMPEIEQADVSQSSFQLPSGFDYVVVSELLEHLPEPESLLEKLRGTYKKSLLLTVPNIAYYKHRLCLLTGHFPKQWQWHPGEHLRYWSIQEFSDLAHSIFNIRPKVISTNGFPKEDEHLPRWHRIWPNLLAEGAVFQISAT